jgi:hypothetical protein
MKLLRVRARGLLLATAVVAGAGTAGAEQMIIKQPGAHPHYSFEVEPHVLLGWREIKDGPGVGVRGTIPLVFNGFVSSINNSVGIGFGFDADPVKEARFSVPIVMQWNFWLSTHWSVFGEPGGVVVFKRGEPTKAGPVLCAGGRLHLSEAVALTLRVGYPELSFGVSFLL